MLAMLPTLQSERRLLALSRCSNEVRTAAVDPYRMSLRQGPACYQFQALSIVMRITHGKGRIMRKTYRSSLYSECDAQN
jgi:hypothetical protein